MGGGGADKGGNNHYASARERCVYAGYLDMAVCSTAESPPHPAPPPPRGGRLRRPPPHTRTPAAATLSRPHRGESMETTATTGKGHLKKMDAFKTAVEVMANAANNPVFR